MQAVILSIGDELVLGQTVDTNSAYLSAELARLGIGTLYHQTIADDQNTIAMAIDQAARSAELVLISGGLGPTEDDLTRQALAQAMGRELVLHEPSLEAIAAIFRRHGQPVPERNRIQAMHPCDSTVIPNACGTAPGIKATLHDTDIYVAPGVPHELFDMFERSICPEVKERGATRHVILTAKLNTFGLGESAVAEKLDMMMDRQRNPLVGTTAGDGIVAVRIRSEFADAQEAESCLEETIKEIRQRLGAAVFGRDDQTIQQSLVSLLAERRLKVATAESCTGGMLGQMITEVPGSSQVYEGGSVTYSNALKVAIGVDPGLIDAHGAVSEPVVEAMALAIAERCSVDLGVAITGVAGPDGGSADKPVGHVCLAISFRGEQDARWATESMHLNLAGQRQMIRMRAAMAAIQMMRLHLLGQPATQISVGRKK